MKKITCFFALGILFSCTNETENPQAFADAEIIGLIKTPDKSTLSQSELKKIVAYLDKNPEDSKYLRTKDSSKDRNALNQNIKNTSKTTEINVGEYIAVEAYPTTGPDWYANLEMNTWYTGRLRATYAWTMLHNTFGHFDVMSVETFDLADHGQNYMYLNLYSIINVNHSYSFIRGNSGSIGWTETSRNVFPGTYGAYFSIAGNLHAPDGSGFNYSALKYIDVSMMASSQGLYTNL